MVTSDLFDASCRVTKIVFKGASVERLQRKIAETKAALKDVVTEKEVQIYKGQLKALQELRKEATY